MAAKPDPGSPLFCLPSVPVSCYVVGPRKSNSQQWPFCDQLMQLPPWKVSVHIRMVDCGSLAWASGSGAGAEKAGRAKRRAAMNCFMVNNVMFSR